MCSWEKGTSFKMFVVEKWLTCYGTNREVRNSPTQYLVDSILKLPYYVHGLPSINQKVKAALVFFFFLINSEDSDRFISKKGCRLGTPPLTLHAEKSPEKSTSSFICKCPHHYYQWRSCSHRTAERIGQKFPMRAQGRCAQEWNFLSEPFAQGGPLERIK